MSKSALKLLGVLIGFLAVFFLVNTDSKANQIATASLTLGDSRPTTSNTHTYLFTHRTAATLTDIWFYYCTTPSSSCTKPTSLDTSAATKGTLSGITTAQWSLNVGTNGTPKLQHVTTGQAVSANTVMTLPLGAVTNHAIDNCQSGGDTSADTCYVRIYSCDAATNCGLTGDGTDTIDEGIVTYTVVAAVTVSARVDPTFTFVVAAVGASTVNNAITTSVASTFSTLPFGNLTASTPKYAAHKLNITTNTQAGYSVTAAMVTQMTGVYSANNIDPFIASWSAPTTWTEPTGSTPNDNTGWIGANTTDTDVSAFDAQEFGAISSTAVTVMSKTSSDDGSSPVYITYGLEANVFQPADTYTGTLIYNATPTY